MESNNTLDKTVDWQELSSNRVKKHLRELLSDEERNKNLLFCFEKELPDITLDLSHEKIDLKTLEYFQTLSTRSKIPEKFKQMFAGEIINKTEGR